MVLDRGGEPLTAADRRAVADKVTALGGQAAPGEQVFPVFADDGKAAFIGVPLSGDIPEDRLAGPIGEIRTLAAADLPDGLRANVTGGPAFIVDLSQGLRGRRHHPAAHHRTGGGGAAAGHLPQPLAVAGAAAGRGGSPTRWAPACSRPARTCSASPPTAPPPASPRCWSSGPAPTTPCCSSPATARSCAARTTATPRCGWPCVGPRPAILASSGTVVLALLCLGLADNPSSRSIGFGGAIGIVTAVVFALLVLPAAMTLFGRGLFWPFVPRVGQREPTRDGVWARLGRRRHLPPLAGHGGRCAGAGRAGPAPDGPAHGPVPERAVPRHPRVGGGPGGPGPALRGRLVAADDGRHR